MPSPLFPFEDRLRSVEQRIQQAAARSGRDRSEITLVAVTKKFSAEIVRTAYALGMRHFGENYVQEFADKHSQLQGLPDANYHFIGHLQSNKARLAATLFQTLETVDSVKLLERLDTVAQELGRTYTGFLEVKLSPEASKTGHSEAALPELVAVARRSKHIQVLGLMTVPPWSNNPEDSRHYFRKLAQLARDFEFSKLSMGMSGDLEVAIEEGATTIRVGTALFGARPKPPVSAQDPAEL